MAKLVNGLNGPFIGKIGSIIGASRNGQHYVKAVPAKKTRKNNKPKTEYQSKFSMAHYWLQPLLNFVRVGYKDFKRSGEFNAAKSFVLNNAFEDKGARFEINPSLVKLSQGDLPMSEDMQVKKVGTNQIQFTWTYGGKFGEGNGADQVMMAAYDVENGRAHCETTGQFRKTGADTLKVNKGKKYHVYAAFTSHDRLSQSDSVYLGEIGI